MQACSICGSTSLSNIDGLFYCDTCGTQNQALRELETEQEYFEGINIATLIRPTKTPKSKQTKSGTKAKLNRQRAKKRTTHFINADVDYPDYLKDIGKRLATSTHLLIRIAHKLHTDFNVPAQVVDCALSLFQGYLSAMHVAFISTEVANEGDGVTIKFKKTLDEITNERLATANSLKEQKKLATQQERSQLPKWEQSLLQAADDAADNEDTQAADENAVDVDIIIKIQTDISRNTFDLAAIIRLDVHILLSIALLACHHVGCDWILPMDLLRWHREDRFSISSRDIYSLFSCLTMNDEKGGLFKGAMKRYPLTRTRSVPATDFYRFISYYVQCAKIPQTIYFPPIEKVLHRLVFDMNLPASFWPRLKILLEFLPRPRSEIHMDTLRQACPFFSGLKFLEHYRKRKKLGHSRFFRINTSNGLEMDHLCMIPIETKAAAIIMLALKLMFALDDQTEYEIDKFSFDRRNNFIFEDWLYQFEFRGYARSGIAVENIVSSTFVKPSPLYENEAVFAFNRPGKIRHPVTHQRLLPRRKLGGKHDRFFYNCFPADHATRPEPQSNLAKFAPTRFHGRSDVGAKTPNIDHHRLEIYLREFNKCAMDFPGLDFGDPMELPENQRFCDQEWRKLFPALARYKRVPISSRHSLWTNGRLALSYHSINCRLRDERRTFSENYGRLLSCMTILVGDKIEFMHFVFSFVESVFLGDTLLTSDIQTQPFNTQRSASRRDRPQTPPLTRSRTRRTNAVSQSVPTPRNGTPNSLENQAGPSTTPVNETREEIIPDLIYSDEDTNALLTDDSGRDALLTDDSGRDDLSDQTQDESRSNSLSVASSSSLYSADTEQDLPDVYQEEDFMYGIRYSYRVHSREKAVIKFVLDRLW